jgi:hypothetical protein
MHGGNNMVYNEVDLGLGCKSANAESQGRVSHILRSTFQENTYK